MSLLTTATGSLWEKLLTQPLPITYHPHVKYAHRQVCEQLHSYYGCQNGFEALHFHLNLFIIFLTISLVTHEYHLLSICP